MLQNGMCDSRTTRWSLGSRGSNFAGAAEDYTSTTGEIVRGMRTLDTAKADGGHGGRFWLHWNRNRHGHHNFWSGLRRRCRHRHWHRYDRCRGRRSIWLLFLLRRRFRKGGERHSSEEGDDEGNQAFVHVGEDEFEASSTSFNGRLFKSDADLMACKQPILSSLNQCRAASDSSMMRTHSSGNSMPTARAAFGSRLLEVMPGIVFTSSTKG